MPDERERPHQEPARGNCEIARRERPPDRTRESYRGTGGESSQGPGEQGLVPKRETEEKERRAEQPPRPGLMKPHEQQRSGYRQEVLKGNRSPIETGRQQKRGVEREQDGPGQCRSTAYRPFEQHPKQEHCHRPREQHRHTDRPNRRLPNRQYRRIYPGFESAEIREKQHWNLVLENAEHGDAPPRIVDTPAKKCFIGLNARIRNQRETLQQKNGCKEGSRAISDNSLEDRHLVQTNDHSIGTGPPRTKSAT